MLDVRLRQPPPCVAPIQKDLPYEVTNCHRLDRRACRSRSLFAVRALRLEVTWPQWLDAQAVYALRSNRPGDADLAAQATPTAVSKRILFTRGRYIAQ